MRTKITTGAAVGVRQDRPRRLRPRARSASASSSCRRAGRPPRSPTPGCPSPRSTTSPARRQMLDHRVVTLHPKIHGGILADRAKPRTTPTSATTASSRSTSWSRNLYPFAQRPEHRDDRHRRPGDGRGPRRRTTPGSASSPTRRSTTTCSTSSTPTTARVGDETRRTPRPRGVRQHRGLRRRDRRVARRPTSRSRSTSTSRSSAPTRRCATARTRTSAARATASRAPRVWWDDVASTRASRSRYLNFYDADAGVAARARPRRPARRAPSSSTPTRAASRSPTTSPTRTSARSSATSGPRSAASSPLNRPIDTATVERMVAGPQADVVIAPGYEPGTVDALIAKRKNTRLLEAGPPEAPGLDFRQISGGFLVQDAHHFAATRDDWRVVTKRAPDRGRVARRRAGVADLRAREVERHRAGEGRPGRRHRRRAAEPGRVGRDRGEEGRRSGRRRRGARPTRSTRSPTASRPRPRPGVAVVVQPGGAMRDEPNIERADELGLAMVFTGERHFLH